MGAEAAAIQLVTRCHSPDEFVERFARFTTETDIVVPAVPHVSVGTSRHFVLRLRDGSVMLEGQCEVAEIRPVAVSAGAAPQPAGIPLMRLRLRGMDPHSCGVHLRLMERRATASKQPAVVVASVKAAEVPTLAASGIVTAIAPSFAESERTEISPSPREEARVAGAAFTLPANPLTDLDASELASFVDLTLLEQSGPIVVAPAVDRETVAAASPITRIARARRVAFRLAPYVACVSLGLSIGIALTRHGKTTATVAAPIRAAPPLAVAPPVPAPEPASDPLPQPSRDCVARVTTTPPGAEVLWGDVALGSTPVEHAAIPCGFATVTLRRERYAEVARTMTADRGRTAVLTERLRRPPAKLMVVSSPSRAIVRVNKQRFGVTPRKISTPRFEHVRVQVALAGYKPWQKTVYLRDAESTVEVALVRIPPAARRTAPRAPSNL